jgi:hypothetical protein
VLPRSRSQLVSHVNPTDANGHGARGVRKLGRADSGKYEYFVREPQGAIAVIRLSYANTCEFRGDPRPNLGES